MKKRGYRSVIAGFAVRALGFIPAAFLTELSAELAHIMDVYIFTPGKVTIPGFRLFYVFLVLIAAGIVHTILDDIDEEAPVRCFVRMIRTVLLASPFILILNLVAGPAPKSKDPGFLLLVDCLAAVILGGIYAVKYISAGREYVRERLDELSWYPKDRENLVRYALMGRRTAQEKLPWPEEKETLRTVALSDTDPKNRAAALEKLPFPEEKETLRTAAQSDSDPKNRAAVLEKLPWPEEKETLRRAALTDGDPGCRAAALKKLPYPEEKEALLTIADGDKDPGNRAAALEKLPWLEERERLIRAALQDEDGDVRWRILQKLPWPIEDKVYLSFIKDCEKTLTAVHQNKVEAEVTKAAERLMELYRRTGSSKALVNIHKGSNPHRDSEIHSDGHEDYYPSCTEFTDYYDEHEDNSTHDDAAHDDYYIIRKPGRQGR